MKRNKRDNPMRIRFSLRNSEYEKDNNERDLIGNSLRINRMFMNIVNKCEKMIFRQREDEM